MVSTAPGRASRRMAGVTLIELVVAMALLVLLATLAAPSMTRLIASQRLKTTASNLHLALVKTRSEALKRNTNVTLSRANNDWSNGWTIEAGATLIDTAPAANGVTVNAGATTSVVYGPNGRVTTGAGTSFVLTSTVSGPTPRCVSVDSSGRPYAKEASAC